LQNRTAPNVDGSGNFIHKYFPFGRPWSQMVRPSLTIGM